MPCTDHEGRRSPRHIDEMSDEELNARIAKEVVGDSVDRDYVGSPALVWGVVVAALSGSGWVLSMSCWKADDIAVWFCKHLPGDDYIEVEAGATTGARAICAAALKAVRRESSECACRS